MEFAYQKVFYIIREMYPFIKETCILREWEGYTDWDIYITPRDFFLEELKVKVPDLYYDLLRYSFSRLEMGCLMKYICA